MEEEEVDAIRWPSVEGHGEGREEGHGKGRVTRVTSRRRDDDGPGRAVKMKDRIMSHREELFSSDFFSTTTRGAGRGTKMVRTDGAKVAHERLCSLSFRLLLSHPP